MGVGKVATGFTLWDSCCGYLLITTTGGQRGQEVILVQNTQIRQSKQGLAIISGGPSKPFTHQGSRRSGNLSWLAAGHTLPCGPLASLCTHSPGAPNVAGVGRGVSRVAADRGVAGVETEGQSWEARGSGTEAVDDGTRTWSFYHCFCLRAKKPGSRGR